MASAFFLRSDVFAGNLDLRLECADANYMSLRHHPRAWRVRSRNPLSRHRGEISSVGGFDRAAELAPKIQLPVDGQGERVSPEIFYDA